MAENQNPQPTPSQDPVTEPPKPGYDALGADSDEPVTDPVKPGYDAEGE